MDAQMIPRSEAIPARDLSYPPLAVNIDVFRLFLASLPYPELLQTTLVSRFFREEATKELLMRPVHLRQDDQLQSFCKFALRGDPGKLAYLRNILIEHVAEPLRFSPEDRQAFAQVLFHCASLRKLEFRWCDVLVEDASIREAISTLPSLAYFAVGMRRDRSGSQAILIQMAMSMKAPLRSLHLPMFKDGLSKVHVLQDLARVRGHLEDFTLQFSKFPPLCVTFPAVRKLYLSFEENIPPLRDLCRTFPSVRELSMSYHMRLDDRSPKDTIDPANGSCWRSLDLLSAPVPIIRALGIACPVRRLDLGYYEVDKHTTFAETISLLRPRMVILSSNCALQVPPERPSILLHGARGEAGVKHLFLKMTFSSLYEAPKLAHFTTPARPLLQSARVELLHVAISELSISSDGDPDEIIDPPVRLYPGLPGPDKPLVVDVDALAYDLTLACASIRTVVITVVYVGFTVWNVTRADGKVTLEKLSAYEGRRVLKQEAKRCLED